MSADHDPSVDGFLKTALASMSKQAKQIAELRAALTIERQRREEAEAERDQFFEYAHEATKAITSIAGGGSELFAGSIAKDTDREMFKADLPFCTRRIRERFDTLHKRLKERAP